MFPSSGQSSPPPPPKLKWIPFSASKNASPPSGPSGGPQLPARQNLLRGPRCWEWAPSRVKITTRWLRDTKPHPTPSRPRRASHEQTFPIR